MAGFCRDGVMKLRAWHYHDEHLMTYTLIIYVYIENIKGKKKERQYVIKKIIVDRVIKF